MSNIEGKGTTKIEAYETAHIIPGNQVTHEYIETARVVISERMIIEKGKSMEYFIVKDEINGHTGDISPSKVSQLLGDKVVRTVLISQSKSLANFKLERDIGIGETKLAVKEFLIKELEYLTKNEPEGAEWEPILHVIKNDEPLEENYKIKLSGHFLREMNEIMAGLDRNDIDFEKKRKKILRYITFCKNAILYYTN
jgi:hypothetical protein